MASNHGNTCCSRSVTDGGGDVDGSGGRDRVGGRQKDLALIRAITHKATRSLAANLYNGITDLRLDIYGRTRDVRLSDLSTNSTHKVDMLNVAIAFGDQSIALNDKISEYYRVRRCVPIVCTPPELRPPPIDAPYIPSASYRDPRARILSIRM